MSNTTQHIRLTCACAKGAKCDQQYCPRVGQTATAEAGLPAGSPGARAAARIRPWGAK